MRWQRRCNNNHSSKRHLPAEYGPVCTGRVLNFELCVGSLCTVFAVCFEGPGNISSNISLLPSPPPPPPSFSLSEHRQRFPLVYRSRVQTQPDPGPEEDAVPSLLAGPRHAAHLSAHPASDISPQVRQSGRLAD